MALEQDVESSHDFFIGDDKFLFFDLGEDVSDWTVQWVLTSKPGWSPTNNEAPLMLKETGETSVSVVSVESGPTNGFRITFGADETVGYSTKRTYFHTLRRVDPGSEAVLAYGTVQFRSSALADPDGVGVLLPPGVTVPLVPGGELGGTWEAPTVDTVHSGSSHAEIEAAAETYAQEGLDAEAQARADADALVVHLAGAETVTGEKTYTAPQHFKGMPWYDVRPEVVGDGVTNDGAALNTARAAVSSAGGGILWYGTGAFLTTVAQIVKSNVLDLGAGPEVTTLKSGPLLSTLWADQAGVPVTGWMVDNMTLDGGAPVPTLVADTGAHVDVGTQRYVITNTVSGVERAYSAVGIAEVDSAHRTVSLVLPLGPTGTTARKVYRSGINSTSPMKLLTTINDNTTTTYVDTTPDASLGANNASGAGSIEGIVLGNVNGHKRISFGSRKGSLVMRGFKNAIRFVGYQHSDVTVNIDFREISNVGFTARNIDGLDLENVRGERCYSVCQIPDSVIPKPSVAPAVDATGSMEAGSRFYAVEHVASGVGGGYGGISLVVVTDATHTKVNLTNIPIGPAGTTSRKIYRTLASGWTGPWTPSAFKLVTTLNDNTTTTYTDSVSDASLAGAAVGTPWTTPYKCTNVRVGRYLAKNFPRPANYALQVNGDNSNPGWDGFRIDSITVVGPGIDHGSGGTSDQVAIYGGQHGRIGHVYSTGSGDMGLILQHCKDVEVGDIYATDCFAHGLSFYGSENIGCNGGVILRNARRTGLVPAAGIGVVASFNVPTKNIALDGFFCDDDSATPTQLYGLGFDGPNVSLLTDQSTIRLGANYLGGGIYNVTGVVPNPLSTRPTGMRVGLDLMRNPGSGAAATLDASVNVQRVLLTGSPVLSWVNQARGRAMSVKVILQQDQTGGRTVTWPANVMWPSGAPPVLSAGAGKIDVIELITLDYGAFWMGYAPGLAFTPLPMSVSGLLVWLDALALNLVDGTAVATWPDRSGNGHDATQATGAQQPLFKTGALFSQPAVRFDGVDDRMEAVFGSSKAVPQTALLVARAKTTNTHILDGSGVGHRRDLFRTSGNVWQIASSTQVGAAPADANYHVFEILWNGASSLLLVDGVTVITGLNAGSDTSTSLRLGSSYVPGGWLNGDIAEVLLYDGDIGATARQTLRRYLGSRWGLAVA